MNASTKTQSALRAALKQEDASLTQRLPAAAQTPVAAPAEKSSEPAAVSVTEAAMEAAVAAPAKAAKAVKAKAAGSKTTQVEAAKSRPAKAVANPPSTTAPVIATATEPAVPAQGKPTRRAARATSVAIESDAPAKKGSARTGAAETDGGKKEKREKVVRDSFSIPASEHRRIKSLREQLGKAGRLSSKSEVLRAGLHLLGERSTTELVAMLDALPAVAKGKRSKKH